MTHHRFTSAAASALNAARYGAHRWPAAPLIAHAVNETRRHHDDGATICDLAHRLGVTRRTVQRWRTTGLTDVSADHAAVRLGAHPLEIWPDWCDPKETT